jgi:hypothetical protein
VRVRVHTVLGLGPVLTTLFSFLVMTEHTGNVLVTGAHYSQTWSSVVLLSMIIFVASYASGLGNLPWQQGELFGLEGVYRMTLR